MNHFDYVTRKSYYIDNFYNDTDIYRDPNFHTRALVDRARYYQYATECVNYELQKQYGLMAQSQIRYCITNKDTIQTTYGTVWRTILHFEITEIVVIFTLKISISKMHFQTVSIFFSLLSVRCWSFCLCYQRATIST